MMHSEGTFARLIELVQTDTVQEDTSLHQILLELLYESSRTQKMNWEDFSTSMKEHVLLVFELVSQLTPSKSGNQRCIHNISPRGH